MTTQPALFPGDPPSTRCKQRGLFDDKPVEAELTCAECGRRLIVTASGFLACSAGHGKLVIDESPRAREGSGDAAGR